MSKKYFELKKRRWKSFRQKTLKIDNKKVKLTIKHKRGKKDYCHKIKTIEQNFTGVVINFLFLLEWEENGN